MATQGEENQSNRSGS